LESARAADLRAAQARYPELEFLLAWPPDEPAEGGIYLQGFIDCLYQDRQGGWHVLDYKTNKVAPKSLAETAAGYEMQLYVYALAAEQVLGEPPRDLVLHFLRTGEEYVFPWNDDARRRLKELVNRAIAEEKATGCKL
jgi:ATP-dependent exoDNAse (exonuclease V) beta subunit